MEVIRIAGTTRTVGLDQQFTPLPLRDELYDKKFPVMWAAFKPSEEDIARQVAGEPIILGIVGQAWPPVVLKVGDHYEDEPSGVAG